MRQSSVIDINGIFVGTAIQQDHSYRFKAVDDRVEPLDGTVFRSLREVKTAASAVFFGPRNPSPRPPIALS
jgi:hypothetical protein